MPPPPPPPPGPPRPPPPPPPVPMGVPADAMDQGRLDLMHSLKGMGNKRLLKPVPRKEKKHFNMIELLKAEEKKKKGGIGVASKSRSTEQVSSSTTKKTVAKPTASELLAVKLRRKETISKVSDNFNVAKVADQVKAPMRCSTTDEELEALFSAIDKEIVDDPDAAVDLLEIIEDDPEDIPEEMQEEIEVIKSNIYLPPEDDYEMQVEEEEEDKEDEEMKEMLAMIENAKGEIDATKEEELLNLMDKLDDDEVFEKFKKDCEGENSKTAPGAVAEIKLEEDSNKNKKRADDINQEKEPSEKKPKNIKKKKALAVGGVSMFGGKDLFGGKNPFASRKQEESSEEEVEEGKSDDDSKLTASNGDIRSLAQAPPHAMPTFNIAVQPDSEEQPVSFDDLPSSTHVILTSNKHRAKLPSRRRPTGRSVHSNGHAANGNGHALESSDNNNGHGNLESIRYQRQ